MSDKATEAPALPTMGNTSKGGARPGAGRPSSKQMDERADGLNMRDAELTDREAALQLREAALEGQGIDPNPAPIQPAQASREHSADNPKAIRKQMSQGKRLDATIYEKEHPDKKLMWVNDMNGDVQRWINAEAEPVPLLENASRSFEGITDAHESKWVRAVGGDDGMGGYYWVYLLMIDPEIYDDVELEPLRQRQQAIKDAMTAGRDASEGAGGELEAYAPNLPTGGRGFEQIQDHMVGRS